MRTRDDVLWIAAAEVGMKESSAGNNRVKYNRAFYGREVSGAAYPWCCAFVWWVSKQAGFNLHKTASCTALAAAYKKAGQWVDYGPNPGDIVMFDFTWQKKITQHVGIVDRFVGDWVYTIEGNTSLTSNDNGGAVMRRKRNPKLITGACRPGYNI